MAWSTSEIFRPYVADVLANTTAMDLDGTDIIKVALYDGTITPAQDVTAANSAYAGGVWSATGGATGTPQVFQAGQWAQAGVALSTPVVNSGSAGIVFFDGVDTASGSAATISNINGCLVYDDGITTPQADQGICFNWFGAPNSVSNGTFTIVWHVNGIFRMTL